MALLQSEILAAVRKHVEYAAAIDRKNYFQEPAYVAAFFGRLDGTVDLGKGNGTITFKPVVVNDHGPGAAEKKFGADFSLTFESVDVDPEVSKAILGQGKGSEIDALDKRESERLRGQTAKMACHTEDYIVFESPKTAKAIPTVLVGNPSAGTWNKPPISFDAYLVDKVISCAHGDRRDSFIKAVVGSSLPGLKVITKGLTFEPDAPGGSNTPSLPPAPSAPALTPPTKKRTMK